jgi:hypothetical protein
MMWRVALAVWLTAALSLFALNAPQAQFNGCAAGFCSPSSSGAVSSATNSLIFTSASSQFLSQTGKITINQQKFTIACWFKTTAVAIGDILNFSDGTATNRIELLVNATGNVNFSAITANSTVASVITTAAFNDGNWHSIVVAVDTTQATANNRVIPYVDGAAAALGTNTQPAQNTNLSNNFAATYDIGARNGTVRFFNGNLAQVYYIDGQRLTPTSFITGTPGVPKTYSGTYTGTFDFFLPFSNGTSTTTLGADGSGEGNNWTLNAMTTANQSTDHP